jgi:hypothetical protein
MSVSPIGSSPTMAALAQSGQPQPSPPATDHTDDAGDATKAATAAGTGQNLDKSA